jgi:elongation factor Ts
MGGRIGVMIDTEGEADADLLTDICMHIAAFNPQFISPDDVPESVLEKEKEIARAQVEGKPAEIIDKIVMGKINKWYTESCLTHQPWIRDDKKSLRKVAPGLTIKRFARWEVGEELPSA